MQNVYPVLVKNVMAFVSPHGRLDTSTMYTKHFATFYEAGAVASMKLNIRDLPVELLELVLMRTFIKLFTDHYKSHYKTHEAIAAAYSALAAVCYSWWQTMNGWPESTTPAWFRHHLSRLIKRKYSFKINNLTRIRLF